MCCKSQMPVYFCLVIFPFFNSHNAAYNGGLWADNKREVNCRSRFVFSLKVSDSWSLIYATWYLKICEDQAGRDQSGGCISSRQFVGEGVCLLAGRCHDNHKSLMQPPSLFLHLTAHSSLCCLGWVGNVITSASRATVTSSHRKHSQCPPDVNLQPISYGWEGGGSPSKTPWRCLTDNNQGRRACYSRRNKHILMSWSTNSLLENGLNKSNFCLSIE